MSKLPTKIEYEERKIGDMPIGRTRFDTIEEKINAIISYLSDQGEELTIKNGYMGEFAGIVKDNSPVFKSPIEKKCGSGGAGEWTMRVDTKKLDDSTPVESEWQKWKDFEMLQKEMWVEGKKVRIVNFIFSLLLTAKAEERKRIEGIIQKMIDDSYKSSPMNPVQLSDILTAIN